MCALFEGLAGLPAERIEQWRADKAHCLSQAQRAVEFGRRPITPPLQRLARQEHLGAVRLERRPQQLFRGSVLRRDVKVGNPSLERVVHQPGGMAWRAAVQHDPAERDDGQRLAGAAQRAAFDTPGYDDPFDGPQGGGKGAEAGGCRNGLAEEFTPMHPCLPIVSCL